jgi:NitT/TauT family transport system ATP-binding protein
MAIPHLRAVATPAEAKHMKSKPLVRLENVDKVYAGGTVALRKFCLEVAHNEFVSLLGPSGCGKSTALRIIAGLGDYSGGTIDWPTAMHDVRGEPEREIGFVFQDPHLMPWATIFENVRLPLKLKNVPRKLAAEKVHAVLEMVGLSGFADSYPRQLSGGMKMRASIARAIVTEPKLLLMDEPFAALDEITRNRLSADLLEIWQRSQCTVMFVTHSVYESVFMSTRIAVMAPRPGRIADMLSIDPGHPRSAEFRQSPVYAEYCRSVSAMLANAMQY